MPSEEAVPSSTRQIRGFLLRLLGLGRKYQDEEATKAESSRTGGTRDGRLGTRGPRALGRESAARGEGLK